MTRQLEHLAQTIDGASMKVPTRRWGNRNAGFKESPAEMPQ